MSRRLLPLAVFAALVVLLGVGLTLNPRLVPSPLIEKPIPDFTLPRLRAPEQRLQRSDILGRVALVNAWATWCVGCREEHALLVEIAADANVPIYGINYKDQYKSALEWLDRFGDPYVANGYDAEGSVGIDFGVYGLPETFVVRADGTIAHKHIGPLTRRAWEEEIRPLLLRLRGGEG